MEQNASSNGSSGDYYINGPSEVNDYINGSSRVDYDRQIWELYWNLRSSDSLIIKIISSIEILIMILTLLALFALIKSQRSTPVFVINLILSDLIQIICILMMLFIRKVNKAYYYSLIVGVYFMACVAVERYLLVSHPVWYRSHHSLKVCCGISVIIWFVPLMFVDVNYYLLFRPLTRSIGCLIPYPIIILCFVGTCRGLSRAISLTPLKRKKILGSLFLVLLTYTFLILPYVIMTVIINSSYDHLIAIFWYLSRYLVFLNPLADCVLYMFIRPDVGGLMKCVHCCCRTHTHQNSTHSRDEHTRDRKASVCLLCFNANACVSFTHRQQFSLTSALNT